MCDFFACPLLCLQALRESLVLKDVIGTVVNKFVAKVGSEWLPDKRFELLYRGTRDGLTASAFHKKCDEKGPTLVLIAARSARQPPCVFGGFAGSSWESPDAGKYIDARDSFLFTVVSPSNAGIVKMPVKESGKDSGKAMLCYKVFGPCFGLGGSAIGIYNSKRSTTLSFDASCTSSGLYYTFNVGIPGHFQLTGAEHFTPLEIEVWSVC